MPAVTGETRTGLEPALVEHHELVDGGSGDDQHNSALAARRPPDVIEAGVELGDRHMLHAVSLVIAAAIHRCNPNRAGTFEERIARRR